MDEKKEENKNDKIVNANKYKVNNPQSENIPFRKLNIKKYNPKSSHQKYKYNIKKNSYNSNNITISKKSKHLLYNRIINNKIKKEENIINIDLIHNSKVNSLRNNYLNVFLFVFFTFIVFVLLK